MTGELAKRTIRRNHNHVSIRMDPRSRESFAWAAWTWRVRPTTVLSRYSIRVVGNVDAFVPDALVSPTGESFVDAVPVPVFGWQQSPLGPRAVNPGGHHRHRHLRHHLRGRFLGACADSWVHVDLFGRSKLEWFQTFLELPNGVPSHDTFGDVFARLDPEQFQSCFMAWTQAIAELLPGEVVAIDGKTARRSYDRAGSKRAMHLVSAWATRNTLTLGQVRTEEKSNEITAIPQLLNLLDLQGCIVTIDAMGCQREIAQQIVDGGADYVLAVKENQGQLHEGIRDLFAGAEALGFDGVPYDYSQTVNKGHGRVERRECWTITETDCLDYINPHGQWPQLKAAIKVVGH